MDPIQTPVQIPDFEPKPNYLKTIIFSVLIIITLSLIGFLFFQNQQLKTESKVTNFIECSAIKGALIQYSYPATCVLPSGKSFTQELSPEEKSNLIPPKEIITEPSTSISPDETAGWKTYTNTEYFYSFKYPKNLILKNIADGADGSLPTNAIMLTLSDPTRPNYEDRLIDIQYLGLLLDVTPKSDWYSTIVKLGDTQAIKFISNKPEVKFDVCHVNIKSGGLEIMTNKTQSTILIDQILSTFKFIDDRSVCVPTYQVETNSVELTAEQNYSVRCTEQRSEKDCFSIDLYNQKADDFSIPDGIPDCIWENPTK